jgi:hypothetical protein
VDGVDDLRRWLGASWAMHLEGAVREAVGNSTREREMKERAGFGGLRPTVGRRGLYWATMSRDGLIWFLTHGALCGDYRWKKTGTIIRRLKSCKILQCWLLLDR